MAVVVPSGDLGGTTLAFTSARDGNGEIYAVDFVPGGAGANERRLTNNGALDRHATCLPAASRVVFTSDRADPTNPGDEDDIYTMLPDGTDVIAITSTAGPDSVPAVSPDGTKIAFNSTASGNYDIWVVNLDGTNLRNLTNHAARDLGATWSPDGTMIAFSTDRDTREQIYTMNADGTNQQNVSNNPGADDQDAAWSPDGLEIAYKSVDAGVSDVYVMNANGASQTNLSSNGTSAHPSWSPDGTVVAFQYNTGVGPEVYVIGRDGTGLTRVTTTETGNEQPAWSPFAPGIPTGGALITVNDAQGQVGGTTTVSITSSALDGLGVTAIDLTLSYDPNLLTPTTDAGGAIDAITTG